MISGICVSVHVHMYIYSLYMVFHREGKETVYNFQKYFLESFWSSKLLYSYKNISQVPQV